MLIIFCIILQVVTCTWKGMYPTKILLKVGMIGWQMVRQNSFERQCEKKTYLLTSTQYDQSLHCPHEETLHLWPSKMHPVKILIRLYKYRKIECDTSCILSEETVCMKCCIYFLGKVRYIQWTLVTTTCTTFDTKEFAIKMNLLF